MTGNRKDTKPDLESLRPKQPHEMVAGVVGKAKSNPWVLTLLAMGGGFGGQEGAMALWETTVPWYYIAIGVVIYGVLQYLADNSKRQSAVIDQLIRIERRLADGASIMKENKAGIKNLYNWKKRVESSGALAAVVSEVEDQIDTDINPATS